MNRTLPRKPVCELELPRQKHFAQPSNITLAYPAALANEGAQADIGVGMPTPTGSRQVLVRTRQRSLLRGSAARDRVGDDDADARIALN